MENQVVLSPCVSSHSERLSVRERLQQVTNFYLHRKPIVAVTVSDETGLSVRERLNRIRDSIRGRRVSPVVVSVAIPVPNKHTPVEAPIHVVQVDDSIPLEEMTQEQVAVAVARDISGGKAAF